MTSFGPDSSRRPFDFSAWENLHKPQRWLGGAADREITGPSPAHRSRRSRTVPCPRFSGRLPECASGGCAQALATKHETCCKRTRTHGLSQDPRGTGVALCVFCASVQEITEEGSITHYVIVKGTTSRDVHCGIPLRTETLARALAALPSDSRHNYIIQYNHISIYIYIYIYIYTPAALPSDSRQGRGHGRRRWTVR